MSWRFFVLTVKSFTIVPFAIHTATLSVYLPNLNRDHNALTPYNLCLTNYTNAWIISIRNWFSIIIVYIKDDLVSCVILFWRVKIKKILKILKVTRHLAEITGMTICKLVLYAMHSDKLFISFYNMTIFLNGFNSKLWQGKEQGIYYWTITLETIFWLATLFL